MRSARALTSAITLIISLSTLPAYGQGPTPVGQNFRVDDYLLGTGGREPRLVLDTEGDFVIVWTSSLSPGSDDGFSIQAKKYSSDGVALFPQFQVNTYTTGSDDLPDVAPLLDGGFVVVWESSSSPGNDDLSASIQFRRFDRDGNGLAPQFQVNTYTTGPQRDPQVASSADGSFVIVWESRYGYIDTSFSSIQGQRYDSTGLTVGTQFKINTLTTNFQAEPTVDSLADGSFVVAWRSETTAGDDIGNSNSIQARRYMSDGSAIGAEFQVNTYTTSRQDYPEIALAPNGDFVIVWRSLGSFGPDNDGFSVQGQRFASDGSAVGDQFQANTYSTGAQIDPKVGIADDGSFTVVWHSSSQEVHGQSFASDGTPAGAEFLLNEIDGFTDADPAIHVDGAGDFLTVWRAFSNRLLGQRFRVTGDIGDRVWQDLNRDGLQDPEEPGLEGVTVELVDDLSQTVATTATDADGNFLFSRVTPGDYSLTFGKLDPFDQFTTLNAGDDALDSDADANGDTMTFSLAPGVTDRSWDAGLRLRSLGDRVWFDVDGNGIQDGSETGAPGVFVLLFTEDFNLVETTTTDADGKYGFAGVEPGTYFMSFSPSPGSVLTAPNQGTDDALDSDPDQVSFNTQLFEVTEGQVDLTIDAGLADLSIVGDRIWLDSDGDGVQDVGEEGINGVGVELFDSFGVSIATTATTLTGRYVFMDVSPRTYYIEITPPPGLGVTAQNQGTDDALDSDIDPELLTSPLFSVVAGQDRIDLDAGLLPAGSVGGWAWLDTDLDGRQDGDESAAMAGIAVELFAHGGDSMGTTTTAADGAYLFTGVSAGSYYLVFTEPAGFCFTAQDQGSDDSLDSDVDPVSFATAAFEVSAGQVDTSWDAGLVPDASVGNRVWLDDGNGIQDGGESGVAGVTVALFDNAGASLDTTTTDADGHYAFSPGPGEYYLTFTLPAERAFAPRDQGIDDGADSDVNPASGTTSTFILGPGMVDTTRDAGLEPTGVGDRVWIDTNGDGLQQPAERGASGVTVRLLDENDAEVASTVTGADGVYRFTPLASGIYRIEVESGGDAFTAPDVGGDDSLDSDIDPTTGRSALFSHAMGTANRGHDAGLLPLFVDGFESGDTDRWDSSTP